MTRPARHVKHTVVRTDGGRAWCGAAIERHDWYFEDAEHVALALQQGTSIPPCRRCVKALNSLFTAELER